MQIYSVGALEMKAEIIGSGTELLLGEVVDTNTPYIARQLAQVGISVYHHSTVGDNPERLLDTIVQAENRSDIVVVSGGLGPTQDDITKDILAEHLGLKLIIDPVSLEKIKRRYQKEEVSKENQHQALVIEDSHILKNNIGMAAGIFLEKNNQYYILLPGPPNEFEQMVKQQLLPLLMKKFGNQEKLKSRNLNFYGLAEAEIAEELSDLIENQTNPTIAIYAKKGIIDIRLTVSGENEEENKKLLDQVEKEIMDRIGHYFISYNKKTMKDIIDELLSEEKSSLSILRVGLTNDDLLSLNENKRGQSIIKASLYFPTIRKAQKHLEIFNSNDNKKIINKEKISLNLNEVFETSYSLVLHASGKIELENKIIPEKLDLLIYDRKGNREHKKLYFNRRMYLADWVIDLKIADFIRHYLLSLEQLKD